MARDGEWREYWRKAVTFGFVENRDARPPTDELGAKQFWIFDLVNQMDEEALQAYLRGAATLDTIPTAQATLALAGDSAPEELAAATEGSWIGVELDTPDGYPATLYRDLGDLDGEPTTISFRRMSPPQLATLSALDFSSTPEATVDELEELLDVKTPTGETNYDQFVAVMDVGQGNANAICWSPHYAPRLYFDQGAGCLWNSFTRPTNLAFCQSYSPNVVLSHWDFDHWFGATLPVPPPGGSVPAAGQGHWLAPKQKVGVRTLKFANGLLAAGKLLFWPNGKARYVGATLEVVHCSGSSKNDSGLAMFVKTPAGLVLCPADAEFTYVPPPTKGGGTGLAGMVASHHGSPKSVGTGVPRPLRGAPLAMSYGPNNKYSHPGNSPGLYVAEGWTSQYATATSPRGGIALGAPARSAPCAMPPAPCSIGTIKP